MQSQVSRRNRPSALSSARSLPTTTPYRYQSGETFHIGTSQHLGQSAPPLEGNAALAGRRDLRRFVDASEKTS